MTSGRVPESDSQNLYFYLSHAHDLAEPQDDLDHWVEVFYRDLVEEIGQRPHHHLTAGIGAYRPCAQNEDKFAEAFSLPVARAFVPLYSPAYLSDECAMAERSEFLASDPLTTHGRIVPVLWQPILFTGPVPELEEVAAISTIADYNARGLLELSRSLPHHATYVRVVAFLADRIVEVTAGSDGDRILVVGNPASLDGLPVLPQTRFVLTVVANEESSGVFPLADRLTAELERKGYYDVVTVRYPTEVDDPDITSGVFLIDAPVLGDVPVPLRKRILSLPASWLVVAVGMPRNVLRLDGPLRERVHELAGSNIRLRMRDAPEPTEAIAQEILGLIRRQSSRTEARPYPSRTRLRD